MELHRDLVLSRMQTGGAGLVAQPDGVVWRSRWDQTGSVAQPEETYGVLMMVECRRGAEAGLIFQLYRKEHQHHFSPRNHSGCLQQSSISSWSTCNDRHLNSMEHRGMQDEMTSMTEKSYQQHLQTEADRLRTQWQLEREKEEMLKYMKALHQQNEELKIQLSEERDQRYTTPESVREVQNFDGRVKGGMSTLFGDRVEGDLQAQHSRPADGGFRRSLPEHGVPGNARSITPPSRRRSRSPPGGKQSHQHAPSGQDSMVQTMLKIMEGMQSMQQQILDQSSGKRASGEGHRDDEYVRGSVELHKLAEWAPESAQWISRIGFWCCSPKWQI